MIIIIIAKQQLETDLIDVFLLRKWQRIRTNRDKEILYHGYVGHFSFLPSNISNQSRKLQINTLVPLQTFNLIHHHECHHKYSLALFCMIDNSCIEYCDGFDAHLPKEDITKLVNFVNQLIVNNLVRCHCLHIKTCLLFLK